MRACAHTDPVDIGRFDAVHEAQVHTGQGTRDTPRGVYDRRWDGTYLAVLPLSDGLTSDQVGPVYLKAKQRSGCVGKAKATRIRNSGKRAPCMQRCR